MSNDSQDSMCSMEAAARASEISITFNSQNSSSQESAGRDQTTPGLMIDELDLGKPRATKRRAPQEMEEVTESVGLLKKANSHTDISQVCHLSTDSILLSAVPDLPKRKPNSREPNSGSSSFIGSSSPALGPPDEYLSREGGERRNAWEEKDREEQLSAGHGLDIPSLSSPTSLKSSTSRDYMTPKSKSQSPLWASFDKMNKLEEMNSIEGHTDSLISSSGNRGLGDLSDEKFAKTINTLISETNRLAEKLSNLRSNEDENVRENNSFLSTVTILNHYLMSRMKFCRGSSAKVAVTDKEEDIEDLTDYSSPAGGGRAPVSAKKAIAKHEKTVKDLGDMHTQCSDLGLEHTDHTHQLEVLNECKFLAALIRSINLQCKTYLALPDVDRVRFPLSTNLSLIDQILVCHYTSTERLRATGGKLMDEIKKLRQPV